METEREKTAPVTYLKKNKPKGSHLNDRNELVSDAGFFFLLHNNNC